MNERICVFIVHHLIGLNGKFRLFEFKLLCISVIVTYECKCHDNKSFPFLLGSTWNPLRYSRGYPDINLKINDVQHLWVTGWGNVNRFGSGQNKGKENRLFGETDADNTSPRVTMGKCDLIIKFTRMRRRWSVSVKTAAQLAWHGFTEVTFTTRGTLWFLVFFFLLLSVVSHSSNFLLVRSDERGIRLKCLFPTCSDSSAQ